MRHFCLTSDSHLHYVRPFAHLWNKYFGAPLEVVGFTPPAFALPSNMRFVSVGQFSDYPLSRWSDALIRYLRAVQDTLVCVWLEDYWLMRPVNVEALEICERMIANIASIGRMDITGDRANSRAGRYAGSVRNVDFIETPAETDYNFSFQASIWRREALLDCLRPGETPWLAEIAGNTRLGRWRVFGTWQWPALYMIAVNKGKLDKTGDWMFPVRTLSDADWSEVQGMI